MKNSIISTFSIALILLLSTNTSKAQQGYQIGVNVMPQLSFLLNSSDADNSLLETSPGLTGSLGLGFGYNFSDNLGVGIDAIYSAEGQYYEAIGIKTFQRLDYFKIPLMISFNTNPNKKAMFLAKVGPQFNLLSSAKILDDEGDELVADNKDQFSDFTIGGALFVGGSFSLTENLLLDAGLRGDIAFLNAEDEDAPQYPLNREVTLPMTTALQIGLRYNF